MNHLKKTIIIPLSFILIACQPHQAKQNIYSEQKMVCKALIDGFLKVSQNTQYMPLKVTDVMTPLQAQFLYQYRASSDHTVRLNTPTRKDLNFECDHLTENNHYQLYLINEDQKMKQQILTLNLPEKTAMKTLTAYAFH